MSGDQNTAKGLRIGSVGCGGCGLLFVLGGFAAVGLVLMGAVNSAEEGTAMTIGGGLCCQGIFALVVAAALALFAKKKSAAS